MWELDHKEGWVPKNWCLWTVVLEKTLSPKSPSDCKEIKRVNPKGNHPWTFTGKIEAELKLQCFGHLMQRTDSLGKTLMLWKIEGRRRKRQQRTKWSDGITESMDVSWASFRRCWRTYSPMQSQRVGHDWVIEQQLLLNYSWWFCQVSLFLFLCSFLVTANIRSGRPKSVRWQTSYSSVRLKQTDILLDIYYSKNTGASWSQRKSFSFFLLSLFGFFLS